MVAQRSPMPMQGEVDQRVVMGGMCWEAGAEPDEWYTLGAHDRKDPPDLAIEVEWSRVLGLDKQEIYKRLGVHELWTLKSDGKLVVRVLEKREWAIQTKSKLLPKLDLAWLLSFLEITPQL